MGRQEQLSQSLNPAAQGGGPANSTSSFFTPPLTLNPGCQPLSGQATLASSHRSFAMISRFGLCRRRGARCRQSLMCTPDYLF